MNTYIMNTYTLHMKNGGKKYIVEQNRHNLPLDNARAQMEVANYRRFVQETGLKGEFGVSVTDLNGREIWLDAEGCVADESEAFWSENRRS